MRIYDEENQAHFSSVLILLTKGEVNELVDKLRTLNPDVGDHIHVSDENSMRQITVSVYTDENIKSFSPAVQKLILDK